MHLQSRRTLAAVVVFLALGGCTVSRPSKPMVKDEKDRKIAPDFTLKDSTGASVKLSALRGQVVLLNFWATWCPPCKIEIPWFINFQRDYKDRNFAVLGVSLDEDGWQSVRPFVASEKINYRVVLGTEELSQIYGGLDALPTTFIIDREGRIAATHVGLISKSEYENEILNLLEPPPTSAHLDAGSGDPRLNAAR
jgi:peroxiredoxin